MRSLVVASKNPDKIREVEEVLADLGRFAIVRGRRWPEVEETGDTLEENALLKARAAREATGLDALADDTGLEVEALGGAPGVHTARFAGAAATYDENVDALLRALDGVEDRTATFHTVVAFVPVAGDPIVASGALTGRIAAARRGTGGFGYDPVFEVDGEGGRTLAELDESHKNRISHRARALQALVRMLSDIPD